MRLARAGSLLTIGFGIALTGFMVACERLQATTPTATPVEDIPEEVTPSPDPPITPVAPATSELFSGSGPWAVTFVTTDGLTLHGTLYGQGAVGVVLASMYIGDQTEWLPFAEEVAAQGFRVLTFDYRGYNLSAGERNPVSAPTDIAAAIAFLRAYQFEPVILIGAGIGGTAAIKAAAQDGEVAGLAVISAPRSFQGLEVSDADLAALSMPTLWLGARNDMTQTVEEMQALTPTGDSTLWIYEGSSLPGTFIFDGADGPDLQRRLLEFVAHAAELS